MSYMKMGTLAVFSTRLKELRGDMSQGDFGKLFGVSRGSISFYENGERTPDAEFLANVSSCFSVSVDYLLGLSEYKNQSEIDSVLSNMKWLKSGFNGHERTILIQHLGFISTRLAGVRDSQLRDKIFSWLSGLLLNFGNMLYACDDAEDEQDFIGEAELSMLMTPHRNAMDILNELDGAMFREMFRKCFKKEESRQKAFTHQIYDDKKKRVEEENPGGADLA